MGVDSPQDDLTWAHLQSALFASIVVSRLLRPARVSRPYPGLTREQSQKHAEARAQRLRQALDVAGDSNLFDVAAVRNPLEHFDERLDAAMVTAPSSVSDWYITDGPALLGEEPASEDVDTPSSGVGLRAYFPLGGVLLFDRVRLDVFGLDAALIELRQSTERYLAESVTRTGGGATAFGPHQLVDVLPPEQATARCHEWLKWRQQVGAPLNVRLVTDDEDDV